ncbi:hypothetical protein U1Q18_015389, partial [Sarracenia purpurea var. burkii]
VSVTGDGVAFIQQNRCIAQRRLQKEGNPPDQQRLIFAGATWAVFGLDRKLQG